MRTKLRVLNLFDPWGSPLCTCPKKYSLNPYTGCAHACFYCYITSYIKDAFKPRLKERFLRKLELDLLEADTTIPVSISNSTDPYQPLERIYRQTRYALKLLKEYGYGVIIVTKSDIVAEDSSLLSSMRATVSVTITTVDDVLASVMEPGAPPPSRRVNAIRILKNHGIPVSVRLDPIIPGINDKLDDIKNIVEKIAPYTSHIVASTYKPRPDSFKRFREKFKEVFERTKDLYSNKIGNTFYLRKDIRRELMEKIREFADNYNMTFSTCREGFSDLQTSETCDGTHLIPLDDSQKICY